MFFSPYLNTWRGLVSDELTCGQYLRHKGLPYLVRFPSQYVYTNGNSFDAVASVHCSSSITTLVAFTCGNHQCMWKNSVNLV